MGEGKCPHDLLCRKGNSVTDPQPQGKRKRGRPPGSGRPRQPWPIDEHFDEPNPRYPSPEAALEAGWDALLKLAGNVLEELTAGWNLPQNGEPVPVSSTQEEKDHA